MPSKHGVAGSNPAWGVNSQLIKGVYVTQDKLAQLIQSHDLTITILYEEDEENGSYFFGTGEFPNGDTCTAMSDTLPGVFEELVISIEETLSMRKEIENEKVTPEGKLDFQEVDNWSKGKSTWINFREYLNALTSN